MNFAGAVVVGGHAHPQIGSGMLCGLRVRDVAKGHIGRLDSLDTHCKSAIQRLGPKADGHLVEVDERRRGDAETALVGLAPVQKEQRRRRRCDQHRQPVRDASPVHVQAHAQASSTAPLLSSSAITIQTHARALSPDLTARATGSGSHAAPRQPTPASVRAGSLKSRGGASVRRAAPVAACAERAAAARAEQTRDHQTSSCAATSSAAQMVAHGHGEGTTVPQHSPPNTFSASVRQIGGFPQVARRAPEQSARGVRRAPGRQQLVLTRQGERHRLVQNPLHQPVLLHVGNIALEASSFTFNPKAFVQ